MDSGTVISTRACDIRALQLSATEAFVLSRIEGRLSLEELAESLGMGLEEAGAIVGRLAALEAIVTEEPTSRYCATFRARTVRKKPRQEPAPSEHPKPAPDSRRPARATPKAAAMTEPEEGGRISTALRRRIAELDAQLGSLSDRGLLGIAEAAGEHEIKRAFARLANTMDPSNYLGIELGAHLAPMERIFARAAAAQEALLTETRSVRARPQVQAEPSQGTRAPRTSSKPARRKSSSPAASPKPPRQASSKPARKSRRMQAVEPPAPAPAPSPPAVPAPLEAPALRPGKPAPPAAAPMVEPAMNAVAYARASEEAYRREMAERQRHSDEAKARTFVEAAQKAEAMGDVVVAAQHYRLALQVHDSEEVRRALGRIDDRAQTIVYEAAKRQGADAERAERWALAAARYGAAYDVIAEPHLADRVAYALLREGRDLRRALKLAEDAVMKEPKNARFRLTLAEVCQAAGLVTRAAGEAERARVLAPQEPRVQELLARLQSDSRLTRR